MRREELEHLIRAAAAITNEYEIVVVGSQSVLGAVPNAPLDARVATLPVPPERRAVLQRWVAARGA